MTDQLTGFLSTLAAIIIFLALRYFYKTRLKDNVRAGKQKIIGIVIIVISILIAVFMML